MRNVFIRVLAVTAIMVSIFSTTCNAGTQVIQVKDRLGNINTYTSDNNGQFWFQQGQIPSVVNGVKHIYTEEERIKMYAAIYAMSDLKNAGVHLTNGGFYDVNTLVPDITKGGAVAAAKKFAREMTERENKTKQNQIETQAKNLASQWVINNLYGGNAQVAFADPNYQISYNNAYATFLAQLQGK